MIRRLQFATSDSISKGSGRRSVGAGIALFPQGPQRVDIHSEKSGQNRLARPEQFPYALDISRPINGWGVRDLVCADGQPFALVPLRPQDFRRLGNRCQNSSSHWKAVSGGLRPGFVARPWVTTS